MTMIDVVNGELKIGGRARAFALRLPRGAPPDALVLLLHGNHPEAGGRQIRQWTDFDRQADAWGLAVAYPDGHEGSGEAPRLPPAASPEPTRREWTTSRACARSSTGRRTATAPSRTAPSSRVCP